MTVSQYIASAKGRLTPLYGTREADWMMRIIFQHLKGWNQVDLIVKGDLTVSEFMQGKADAIIERLLRHEPLQYIIGEAYWHGMNLKVTPAVLIPRPETSELIDIIVSDNQRTDLRVLDACTGSGCIAVALAVNLPFPRVSAFDISTKAIEVARENAEARKVKIDFTVADALKRLPYDDESVDILVSNPPYIAEGEKADMDKNVLEYEPHTALFVPDSDPLEFYTPLAKEGLRILSPEGRLYFEINPLFAAQLAESLRSMGWQDVEILTDMHGKKRFATARKQS